MLDLKPDGELSQFSHPKHVFSLDGLSLDGEVSLSPAAIGPGSIEAVTTKN